jgi:hypothetical protein
LSLIACAILLLCISSQQAIAQGFVNATDDANTSNDTSRGPTTTNDRADFIEIRNFQQVGPPVTTRKKIGYFKFNIGAVNPAFYSFATMTALFQGGRDGNGTFTVFGLNDGVETEATWNESTLTYAMGLGVNPGVAPDTLGDLGIDLAEVTQLGTITCVDGQPLQSNTTDLPLANFLNADTNDVVTFLIADMTAQTEWRLVAREASPEQALRLAFFPKPGDTNVNGTVDLDDLTPIRTNYLKQNALYTEGDLNGNGTVDFTDFRTWKNAFIAGGAGSLDGIDLSFASVPEPSTAILAAITVFGMLSRRHRCKDFAWLK